MASSFYRQSGICDGVIANILDGNFQQYGIPSGRGGEAPLPHQFVVDMGAATTGMDLLLQSQQFKWTTMKDIEIFKSNDNSAWTSVGTFIKSSAKAGNM